MQTLLVLIALASIFFVGYRLYKKKRNKVRPSPVEFDPDDKVA